MADRLYSNSVIHTYANIKFTHAHVLARFSTRYSINFHAYIHHHYPFVAMNALDRIWDESPRNVHLAPYDACAGRATTRDERIGTFTHVSSYLSMMDDVNRNNGFTRAITVDTRENP